jgi:hypothetical protein
MGGFNGLTIVARLLELREETFGLRDGKITVGKGAFLFDAFENYEKQSSLIN